jgi:hypothetical protein
MATLGRTLGPLGNARSTYEAANKAGLKLGMTVKELDVYMTWERKILKGPHKDEMEAVIVTVTLFELLDVHKTHDFKCADGTCNQADFLQHKYTPKRAHHLETRFRYRRSASLPRAVMLPLIEPLPLRHSAETFNGRRQLGCALVAASNSG